MTFNIRPTDWILPSGSAINDHITWLSTMELWGFLIPPHTPASTGLNGRGPWHTAWNNSFSLFWSGYKCGTCHITVLPCSTVQTLRWCMTVFYLLSASRRNKPARPTYTSISSEPISNASARLLWFICRFLEGRGAAVLLFHCLESPRTLGQGV